MLHFRVHARTRCAGPNDPPLTELQTALLNAGELLSLLQGKRGVALVQLHVGWDAKAGQPVLRPLTLTVLEQALAAPGVRVQLVPTPGNPKLGLTAVVYADKEPWSSWAAFLAGFGCQVLLSLGALAPTRHPTAPAAVLHCSPTYGGM